MRSSSFRPALALASLLVLTPFGRLAGAEPAKPDAASPVSAAPVAAPASTVPAAEPVAAPVAAPTPAPILAETPAPVTTPAPSTAAAPVPAPAAAPTPVPDQDTADAKLAVVLRSYTLLRDENDQLKAAAEKSAMEKSSLEAQLAVAKDALPLAAQASALREQLRQTQDQLAALSLENNQLKTRLSLGGPAPGSVSTESLHPMTVATAPAPVSAPTPAAAPAPRIHVVAAGETLARISRQYYGTTSRWPEILAANRDVLHDEKSLIVGVKLRIP